MDLLVAVDNTVSLYFALYIYMLTVPLLFSYFVGDGTGGCGAAVAHYEETGKKYVECDYNEIYIPMNVPMRIPLITQFIYFVNFQISFGSEIGYDYPSRS